MTKKWYLGAMNDGLFIIDTPPRPSTDDQWHDRPDGPSMVLNVTELPRDKAQAIVDAHNVPDRFAYWNSLDEAEKEKIRQSFNNDMFGGTDD